jgi:ABC-type polysaccharide/polyol phosphate export permease
VEREPVNTLRSYVTHFDLFSNFVRRELRVRYRRTALGWLWAFVNPAINTLIYSFVFVVVFRIKPNPGDPSGNAYFAFFLLSASLPFNFLSGSINGGIGALMSSGPLMGRVWFPRHLVPVASVVALAVSFLIELAVLVGLLLAFGYNALPYVPALLALVVLQTVFLAGLTLYLSALNVRYRDVQHLVGVGLLVWFYLTPVLYGLELIPERSELLGLQVPVRSILMFNPMTRFVTAYRNCLFDLRYPSLLTWLACVLAAVVSFSVGSTYFNRRSKRFAEEL